MSRENQSEHDHAIVRVAERAPRPTWPTWRSLPGLSGQGIARRAAWTFERLIALPLAFPIAIALLSRAYSSALLLVAPAFRQDPLPVLTAFRSPFLAWDAQWFLSIARWGYHASPLQAGGIDGHYDFAFYPGWPGLVRFFGGLGIPIAPAAVVAANLLFIAALVVIFAVLEHHFGTDSARRGVTLLAFSPAAYIFSMAYSEPLFLLLTGLYFLGRTRPLSPVLAGLAMLTRVTGLAIAVSAAVRWLRDRRDWPALLAVLTTGAVFAGWWLFIWRLTGDPAGWVKGSPSWQTVLGIPAILEIFQYWYTNWLFNVAFASVMLGGAIWLLRTNLELGVYSAVAIAMSLLGAPVDSMPRHAMMAFPVFAFFGARLGHRKSVALAIGLALLQIWFVGLTQVGRPALAP
ncbi:MAG: mannosyltransferase family protein [Chloroflexota bacterium]